MNPYKRRWVIASFVRNAQQDHSLTEDETDIVHALARCFAEHAGTQGVKLEVQYPYQG